MSLENLASLCVDDVITKVKTVSEFNRKTFYVYSEDELVAETSGLHLPCAGVGYGGIRAISQEQDKTGLGADLNVSILVMLELKQVSRRDSKTEMTGLLDAIRNCIKTTKSPAGHMWRFVDELPFRWEQGLSLYQQRWITRVMLT